MDGARARSPPGEHGLTRGRPGLTPGGFRPPPALSGLKDAPPFRSHRLPGKGRSFPGRCHRRHGNAAILANGPRGAGLRGRGLVGRGRSMDGLFVEEVAASLVREFLSRKVRGAAPHSPGQLLRFGGEAGSPLATSAPSGRETFPGPLPAPEVPDRSSPLPGPGNYISQEPFLPPRTSRPPGGTRPPARASARAAGAGRRPGRFSLPGSGRAAARASAQAWPPSSATTPPQDVHPKGGPRAEKVLDSLDPSALLIDGSVAAALFDFKSPCCPVPGELPECPKAGEVPSSHQRFLWGSGRRGDHGCQCVGTAPITLSKRSPRRLATCLCSVSPWCPAGRRDGRLSGIKTHKTSHAVNGGREKGFGIRWSSSSIPS